MYHREKFRVENLFKQKRKLIVLETTKNKQELTRFDLIRIKDVSY